MKNKSGFSLILVLVILIVCSLIIVFGYEFYKSFFGFNMGVENVPTLIIPNPTNPSNLPTTSSIPSKALDMVDPVVNIPQRNAKIANPLNVTGTVPPGWMFEGTFPIKLLDDQKNLIIQSQAKETTPGSWQKNYPVSFEATLNFYTTAKSGFLVLENDNPSGLTENSKSYEIPINF